MITLDGGAGNDTLTGGAGDDILVGGVGIDTADYTTVTQAVLANLDVAARTVNGVTLAAAIAQDGLGGVDTLSTIENISGGGGNDILYGNTMANILNGNAGNDTLIGGAGNDILIGGAGLDTVDYTSATAGILVNLGTISQTLNGIAVAANTVRDGLGGIDTVSGLEKVIGSSLADVMVGSAGADRLLCRSSLPCCNMKLAPCSSPYALMIRSNTFNLLTFLKRICGTASPADFPTNLIV